MLAGTAVAREASVPAYGIYAYTAREWDPEVNLYYYRARYYDPKIGRFISEDPIGFYESVNFYAYVRGNPVGLIDPSGLWGTGPPDPNRNTVVCDGRGGMDLQLPSITRWGPGKRSCLGVCLIAHEVVHMKDAKKANPDLCVGQAKGRRVMASGRTQAAADAQRADSERRACAAMFECLDRMAAADDCCKAYVAAYKKRMRRYCSQF